MAEQTAPPPPPAGAGDEDAQQSLPQQGRDERGQPADVSELIAALGADKLVAAHRDEHDVSIVYIDRRTQTIYGAGAQGIPRHGPIVTRIGDVGVTALPAGEVVAVQATFTAPTGYDAAQAILREHGVLLLYGPPGSGKRSAAIKLLAALTTGMGERLPIYELNPDLRLADLDADTIPANTPLLLETPDSAALTGMTPFGWKKLVAKLASPQHDNGLVITLERLPEGFPADWRKLVSPWQLAWPGDRTAVQWNILQRHLSYRAAQEPNGVAAIDQHIAAWQQHPGLSALIAQRLTPTQIVSLAELLLPVLTDSCDVEAALARYEGHVGEAVQNWFERGNHSLDLKTLLVAAAVYNEALADEVESAAADLLQLLAPAGAKQEPAGFADPFQSASTRSTRFQQVGAGLVTVPIAGMHYGSTSGQVLRLNNAAWQKAVLGYIWTELSPLREPLLAWLERGVVHGNGRQRVRAAAAIGALARLNFALIEERVLRQWANSSNPDLRRAAGQVLGITIWDEQHSAASLGLLRYWAASDNWRYRWTATAACGGLAGQRYPQQTLDTLERIAAVCIEQPQLLQPAAQALINLFLAAGNSPEQRATLLHTLRRWSERKVESTDERRRVFAVQRTAVLCFWMILWPAAGDPAWRLLVEDMAVPGVAMQVDGVALLRASLNFRQPAGTVSDNLHPRKLARKGLYALAEALARDGDGDLFNAWHGVLQTLASACRQADAANDGGEELERLRYYGEDWEALPSPAGLLHTLFL